jgi:sugar lactone lactonase YvrE
MASQWRLGLRRPLSANILMGMGWPFSPDGRTPYVANTRTCMSTHAFDVHLDGSLTNHCFFACMPSPEESVLDGMKVDVQGRILCMGPGGSWVVSPTGKHLGTIGAPQIPANCALAARVKAPEIRVLYDQNFYSLEHNERTEPLSACSYHVHSDNAAHACITSRALTIF